MGELLIFGRLDKVCMVVIGPEPFWIHAVCWFSTVFADMEIKPTRSWCLVEWYQCCDCGMYAIIAHICTLSSWQQWTINWLV
jgi:hypothetical protein